MNKNFDIVVLGLGAMGSAAIYQLSRTRKRILGIDQFHPPHSFGSSHGDTRITRQAVGEGSAYVPLILRSNEIWKDLEAKTEVRLLHQCGGLIYGGSQDKKMHHGFSNFLDKTISVANEYDIEHQLLSGSDISKHFPQFKHCDSDVGYYEPGAGYLLPESCIEMQLARAVKNGAKVCLHEPVKAIEPKPGNDGVRILTNKSTYETETLIICAGAWLKELLPVNMDRFFQVYRQILYWFDYDRTGSFSQQYSPIFVRIDPITEKIFYGFPPIPHRRDGIKVATDQYEVSCTPNTLNREVTSEEIDFGRENFSRFLDISNACLHAEVCMYTVTPDRGFIIDWLPDYPQIIIASPCSGHGFKHSAAIGEILKQLATTGRTLIDISAFSLSRFSK